MSNELGYTTNEQYYVNVADDGVSLANDQLGWEKTTQVNFGLDFGVLNNRLSGSIDAYFSRTNDLLMATTIFRYKPKQALHGIPASTSLTKKMKS